MQQVVTENPVINSPYAEPTRHFRFTTDGITDEIVEERTADYGRDAGVQAWRFPQVLAITKRWLRECGRCKDDTFHQLLLLIELAHDAADKISRAIVSAGGGGHRLLPILRPYDTVGSTRYVDFDTTRPIYPTRPDQCRVSHVAVDTESQERETAQAPDDMEKVVAYMKNQGFGFTISYTVGGDERRYLPDFVVRVNDGGLGRWAFPGVSDPWDLKQTVRAKLPEWAVGTGVA